jgi:hypothetical protein
MKASPAASSPAKAVKAGAVVRVDVADKTTIAAAVGRMVRARVVRADGAVRTGREETRGEVKVVKVKARLAPRAVQVGVVRTVREARGEDEAARVVVKAAVATGWVLVVLPVAAVDNDNPPIKLSRSIGRH